MKEMKSKHETDDIDLQGVAKIFKINILFPDVTSGNVNIEL